MRLHLLGALVAASLCASHAQAAVVGTVIPATNAKDMVYDEQRGIVYVTDGSQVLRYNVATGKFLPPKTFGKDTLYGIDLSPDRKTIAVADGTNNAANKIVLHFIDADSLVDSPQVFSNTDGYDLGTFSVAYAANGDIIATESYSGSGWPPMRLYTASKGTWGLLGPAYSFTQNSMVSASGNGNILAFANANISDGEWGAYNSTTHAVVHRTGYTDGTSGFNFDVGTNANGSQFYVQFFGGAEIFDANYKPVVKWTNAATGYPVGGAYHPVKALAYFPWAGTSEVRIFDMTSMSQVGSMDFGTVFNDPGIFAFETYNPGHTKLSRDGSLLMVNVGNGVRIFRMYAPLAAANASASTVAGQAVSIPVSASLGIKGDFSFDVPVKPAHGTASIVGNTVVYTPDSSFSGTETFTYQAHYSRAVANGTITVQVQPLVNHPPVAVYDTILLHQAVGPVLLDVLANDSDPDGQALSIIAATQPKQGTVAIQGNKILFTPANSAARNAGFSYTISDGDGGTATANVHVAFVSTGN